jgi:hypothetical protein
LSGVDISWISLVGGDTRIFTVITQSANAFSELESVGLLAMSFF